MTRPPKGTILQQRGISIVWGAGISDRVSPASTFKIPHALAALDSGVLAGPSVTFTYEGADELRETWKGPHSLATAMRYSVVWYFQRVATMLGPERERAYLTTVDGTLIESWASLNGFKRKDDDDRDRTDIWSSRSRRSHEQAASVVNFT